MTTKRVSEMGDEELSKAIIEKLGESADGLPEFISARNPENAREILRRKYWKVINLGPDGSSGRFKYAPIRHDMVNDANMTVMLMEKLISIAKDGVVFSSNGDRIYCVIARTDMQGRGELGRSVAEAFYEAFYLSEVNR